MQITDKTIAIGGLLAMLVFGALLQRFLPRFITTASTTLEGVRTDVTPTPTPHPDGLTLTEVAAHDNELDCWVVVENGVYNVTSFIDNHPGGRDKILAACGKNASEAFATHRASSAGAPDPHEILASMKIGSIQESDTVIAPTHSDENEAEHEDEHVEVEAEHEQKHELPATVSTKYPDATIIEIHHHEDDSHDMKITTEGACHAIKTNANGVIVDDSPC